MIMKDTNTAVCTGLWLKVEETIRHKMFTKLCASLPGTTHLSWARNSQEETKALSYWQKFDGRTWAMHKLRLLTLPVMKRVSQIRFVGGCELPECSWNGYKCKRVLVMMKIKTRFRKQSLENKQPSFQWIMSEGKQRHFSVAHWKEGGCWPLHPGQSVSYRWMRTNQFIFKCTVFSLLKDNNLVLLACLFLWTADSSEEFDEYSANSASVSLFWNVLFLIGGAMKFKLHCPCCQQSTVSKEGCKEFGYLGNLKCCDNN